MLKLISHSGLNDHGVPTRCGAPCTQFYDDARDKHIVCTDEQIFGPDHHNRFRSISGDLQIGAKFDRDERYVSTRSL